MKFYKEERLADFHFWDNAIETVKYLTTEDLDALDKYMTKNIHKFFRAGEVNDFFSFEKNRIAEVLGFNDWESLVAERSK